MKDSCITNILVGLTQFAQNYGLGPFLHSYIQFCLLWLQTGIMKSIYAAALHCKLVITSYKYYLPSAALYLFNNKFSTFTSIIISTTFQWLSPHSIDIWSWVWSYKRWYMYIFNLIPLQWKERF